MITDKNKKMLSILLFFAGMILVAVGILYFENLSFNQYASVIIGVLSLLVGAYGWDSANAEEKKNRKGDTELIQESIERGDN